MAKQWEDWPIYQGVEENGSGEPTKKRKRKRKGKKNENPNLTHLIR